MEKYPDFRFENGNLEPKNEEEIYLAASLLLYFVCVNSKDLDIKKAMCSELSAGDQEIILKFSKSLMDCNDISSTDVLIAIAGIIFVCNLYIFLIGSVDCCNNQK